MSTYLNNGFFGMSEGPHGDPGDFEFKRYGRAARQQIRVAKKTSPEQMAKILSEFGGREVVSESKSGEGKKTSTPTPTDATVDAESQKQMVLEALGVTEHDLNALQTKLATIDNLGAIVSQFGELAFTFHIIKSDSMSILYGTDTNSGFGYITVYIKNQSGKKLKYFELGKVPLNHKYSEAKYTYYEKTFMTEDDFIKNMILLRIQAPNGQQNNFFSLSGKNLTSQTLNPMRNTAAQDIPSRAIKNVIFRDSKNKNLVNLIKDRLADSGSQAKTFSPLASELKYAKALQTKHEKEETSNAAVMPLEKYLIKDVLTNKNLSFYNILEKKLRDFKDKALLIETKTLGKFISKTTNDYTDVLKRFVGDNHHYFFNHIDNMFSYVIVGSRDGTDETKTTDKKFNNFIVYYSMRLVADKIVTVEKLDTFFERKKVVEQDIQKFFKIAGDIDLVKMNNLFHKSYENFYAKENFIARSILRMFSNKKLDVMDNNKYLSSLFLTENDNTATVLDDPFPKVTDEFLESLFPYDKSELIFIQNLYHPIKHLTKAFIENNDIFESINKDPKWQFYTKFFLDTITLKDNFEDQEPVRPLLKNPPDSDTYKEISKGNQDVYTEKEFTGAILSGLLPGT